MTNKHMRNWLLLGGLFLLSLAASAANDSLRIAQRDAILAQITGASLPERTLTITSFGAKGDGKTDCKPAFDKAMKRAAKVGGARIVVPAGTYWLEGPIHFVSNVNLELQEGATLKFSPEPSSYLPLVKTSWEGTFVQNYSPFIYGYGLENVAITGRGTIDGNAGSTFATWRSKQREGQQLSRQMNHQEVPVAERNFGESYWLRPQLINLCHCTRVLIEGVSLRNSPFWVIHPLFCEDLTVRGVDIFSHGPNSDGCDPESCNDVLIEDCRFDTGDDCIAIKSGRNMDGRRWDTPSSNIIVRRCEMKDGHGGVVIGSEISGGCRNVYVEDCRMDSPNLDRVIRIKTNNCRGGVVDGVYVRRVDVGQCREAVLKINLLYESREDCDRSYPPYVRNVMLDHVTSGKSQYGVLITGYEDRMNIENVSVTNSSFDGVEREPLSIRGAKGLHFDNFRINGKAVDN